jgi:hypothetical protein
MCWWLTSVILVIHKVEIRRPGKPAQANNSVKLYLENPFTKIGLVEWLKVKALSSSPSTTKK